MNIILVPQLRVYEAFQSYLRLTEAVAEQYLQKRSVTASSIGNAYGSPEAAATPDTLAGAALGRVKRLRCCPVAHQSRQPMPIIRSPMTVIGVKACWAILR